VQEMSSHRGLKGSAAGWFITMLALMLYTAFHTYQFITIALPGNSKIWGYLALGAFDAGALGWLLAFMFHSRGTVQRVIAAVMALASFAGMAAGLILDTFLQAGRNGYTGKVDQGTVDTILWFAVAIILLHVFAGGLYLVFDPANTERMAAENLRGRIEAEARKQTEQQVEILAAQLAPRMAADQMAKMQTKYLAGLGSLPPRLPAPAPSRQPVAPAKKTKTKIATTVKSVPKMRLVGTRTTVAPPGYNPPPRQAVEYVIGTEQPQFHANAVNEAEVEIEGEEFEMIESAQEQEQEVENLDFLSQHQPSQIPVKHYGRLVRQPEEA
jgi:hypothetical protein